MIININTVAPPNPQYVVEVAEAASEAIRVANHQTLSHEALESPADADVVLASLATMAHRVPQLLEQIVGWLDTEATAGRLEVTSGRLTGRPGLAVTATRMRLASAATLFREAEESLDDAHEITATMVPAGADEEGQ